MATIPTAAQRADTNPIMKEWVIAKDKENAVPVGPSSPTAATVPIPTPNTTTKTIAGPFLGTPNPTVTIPTPTPNKTPTTPVQNGTLQGPYINPSNGQAQQGANVVNGQIQYNQSQSQPPPPTVNTGPTTPQQGLYQDPFAKSREDIAKLAADRIAKILQAGRTSAAGARTGAKNAYDYTNQIEGDNRVLRNASMKESANPFGGSFGYQAAMNNRNDSIQDTAQDKDYNAQVGLINQKLADLEAAAPGDEQAIIDELEQIERQTGISVAQLQEQQKQNQLNQSNYQQTFNYNSGQDSIKNGQNQQVIDYNQDPNNPNNYGQSLTNQLNELKIGNYSTEVKQQAQLFEQELKSGKMTNETAEYNLKQLKDPNSPKNQADRMDLEMKKMDSKNYPEKVRLEMEQLQKTVSEIGKVHYKPQTDAEIAQDKVTLATATKQLADIAKGIYPSDKPGQPQTAETYSKYLDSIAQYTKDPDTGASVLSNPDAVESAILTSGMSQYEIFKSYKAKGLPWKGPIPEEPGK